MLRLSLFFFQQGQCFIAVDPNSFMPGFEGRMSDLMGICRNQEPVRHLANCLLFESRIPFVR